MTLEKAKAELAAANSLRAAFLSAEEKKLRQKRRWMRYSRKRNAPAWLPHLQGGRGEARLRRPNTARRWKETEAKSRTAQRIVSAAVAVLGAVLVALFRPLEIYAAAPLWASSLCVHPAESAHLSCPSTTQINI